MFELVQDVPRTCFYVFKRFQDIPKLCPGLVQTLVGLVSRVQNVSGRSRTRLKWIWAYSNVSRMCPGLPKRHGWACSNVFRWWILRHQNSNSNLISSEFDEASYNNITLAALNLSKSQIWSKWRKWRNDVKTSWGLFQLFVLIYQCLMHVSCEFEETSCNNMTLAALNVSK